MHCIASVIENTMFFIFANCIYKWAMVIGHTCLLIAVEFNVGYWKKLGRSSGVQLPIPGCEKL